ncbi:MAG: GPP34 family phosphoprotein [Chloroflexota bacterium]
MLSLPEELMLLALDDHTGERIAASQTFDTALDGAVILELCLQSFLTLVGDDRYELLGGAAHGTLLDDVTRVLGKERHSTSAAAWLQRVRRDIPDIDARVANSLVAQGCVRVETKWKLWVFPRRRYPAADTRWKEQIRDRLRRTLVGGEPPDRRTAALIGLAHMCGLIEPSVRPANEHAARERAVTLTGGGHYGDRLFADHVLDAVLIAMLATTAAVALAHATYADDGGIDFSTDWHPSYTVTTETSSDQRSDDSSSSGWFGGLFSGSSSDGSSGGDSGGWGDSGGGDSGGGGDGGGGGD